MPDTYPRGPGMSKDMLGPESLVRIGAIHETRHPNLPKLEEGETMVDSQPERERKSKGLRMKVMVAPVISISSDSSDESVGSSISPVILFGSIPIEVPVVTPDLLVAPEVGAAAVASPIGVLELDIHSSSESGPSEGSLPPVPLTPMVLPFLCSDDSESDTELPERHLSSAPHDAMVARWRSRVASQPSSPSGSSSPTTSTSEILTAPILPAPPTIVAPSTDIISHILAPSTDIISPIDIPVGRLYHTYPGGPCRALKVRKTVGPLPSYRLALRYTSHHLDRFTSGSSSDHSSSDCSLADHSSSGHSTSDHTLYGHTSLATIIVYSPTPSRFVYPPPARTSWGTEAFCRWRAAQLSTMYPLTTSESSARDSSSESSVGPSIKRCRSPAATMPLPIPTLGALVPTRVNLLPPHKRFRDSYSSEDSIEEDIDADVLADIEADAGVDDGIGMEVSVEVVSEDDEEYGAESSTRGTVEIEMNRVIEPVVVEDIAEPTSENYHDLASVDGSREVMQMGLDVAMQELYTHMHKILVDRIMEIEAGHRQLEVESLITSGERAGLLDRVVSLERSNTRLRDTLRMESVRVDGFRRRMGYMEDELRQIRMFRYNDRLRFRRFEAFTTRRLVFVPRVILSRAVYELYTSGRASY
ncbi:hypothetical protein Tco_0817057 [Tanacetum coccineum]